VIENLILALKGIWSHKLRSLLTMLGIIIGIASIITIVSTIKGTNEEIKENLVGSGTNSVMIKLFQNDNEFSAGYGQNADGVKMLSNADKVKITQMDGVENLTVFHKRDYSDSTYYNGKSFNGSIYGIDDEYFKIYGYTPIFGKKFEKSDYNKYNKRIIIDDIAASALFQGGNPIGEFVEVAGEPFEIIGVVEQEDRFIPTITSVKDYYMYNENSSGKMFIVDNNWPIVFNFDEPQTVSVKTFETDEMTVVGKKVATYLTDEKISKMTKDFTYKSEDLLKQATKLQKLSNSTNFQLVWISSISLLVGGIGVMNIMLVSVTERTSEIGLKKAIGAKRKRILYQFLWEAATLTSLGGVIGVLCGVGLSRALSDVMEMPVSISIPAIIVAVAFSTVIGLVFGFIPAVKASKLNPIVALQRD